MDFLRKSWSWTKENFSWLVIGTNVVVISFVLFYTVQSASIVEKYEIQNDQLIENNTVLIEQNRNLSGLLNQASDIFKKQNETLQRQKILIDMQHEGINKLLRRVKELERFLNDDFIAAS
jgi:peptidoglycan hydrolase CwlO-like protein